MDIREAMPENASYVDAKGRTRWHRNDWLGEKLGELHDFLVIAGYDASHASRYPKLAHEISRHPEPIDRLVLEDRLSEISGIGPTVATIITQILATGTSDKLEDWARDTGTPRSVLEMRRIPRLGAKTIRALYVDLGIDSMASLRSALDAGRLETVPGIGPKMRETIRAFAGG